MVTGKSLPNSSYMAFCKARTLTIISQITRVTLSLFRLQGRRMQIAMEGGGFRLLNGDIVQNILGRLPAVSFAAAYCVSKYWYHICNRILCCPKLASALSLDPSLEVAVKEVLDKVLSEPIRPHFAIACIGIQFSLEVTHHLITERFGFGIPIIVHAACGIVGPDAVSNEPREVKWEFINQRAFNFHGYNLPNRLNKGIVLVVGYLPGLKVDTIPLLRPKREPQEAMVDKFVMDIQDYTASVSGCNSPVGIVMFGDQYVDMKPIVAKIDNSFAEETAIVGDACGCFLCRRWDGRRNYSRDAVDAVALVFARDINKSIGIGETEFHVTVSSGMMPFGPRLRVVSVTVAGFEYSWLCVLVEEHNVILHGETFLSDLETELDCSDLYIGVTHQRECGIGSENSSLATSLSYYKVLGANGEFLMVVGTGIDPGDVFLFYHLDFENAVASCALAYDGLRTLKVEPDSGASGQLRGINGHNDNKREVFGGFIFSSNSRGESFFGEPNAESAPFVLNFPKVPLVGAFCFVEIGRGKSLNLTLDADADAIIATSSNVDVDVDIDIEVDDVDDDDEGDNDDDNDHGEDNDNYNDEDIINLDDLEGEEGGGSPRCCMHVCSTVYLVMSYIPPEHPPGI